MLPNDNIFNFITLIVITLIGLWSEELAATLTVLAYSLRIYQEVSNLNLKPSELHRRQRISRKYYTTENSLSTWQNININQSARFAKGLFWYCAINSLISSASIFLGSPEIRVFQQITKSPDALICHINLPP